uniref:Siah interacting protein N-terminal domain-containing protein n=1 Tax=Timema bartmani TaxID=61472 RepID=A0A7R9F6G7_9NEOP|nr:unnamed protein product [Timema bartmani]
MMIINWKHLKEKGREEEAKKRDRERKKLQLDVEELNKFLVAAQRQRVKEYLISQIKSLQTEIASLKQASQHDAFCNIKFSASNKPSCYEVKLNNYDSTSHDALLMATEMKLRKEGKRDSAAIVKELCFASPKRGTTIKKGRKFLHQKLA